MRSGRSHRTNDKRKYKFKFRTRSPRNCFEKMNVEQSKFLAYKKFIESKHKDLNDVVESGNEFTRNLKLNGVKDEDLKTEKRRIRELYQKYTLLQPFEQNKFILELN